MTFTTQQASNLSGASARQLQNWDETGTLSVEHVGHSRCYYAAHVRTAWLLAELPAAGAPKKKVYAAAKKLFQLMDLDTRIIIFALNGAVHGCESLALAADIAMDHGCPVVIRRLPEHLFQLDRREAA